MNNDLGAAFQIKNVELKRRERRFVRAANLHDVHTQNVRQIRRQRVNVNETRTTHTANTQNAYSCDNAGAAIVQLHDLADACRAQPRTVLNRQGRSAATNARDEQANTENNRKKRRTWSAPWPSCLACL